MKSVISNFSSQLQKQLPEATTFSFQHVLCFECNHEAGSQNGMSYNKFIFLIILTLGLGEVSNTLRGQLFTFVANLVFFLNFCKIYFVFLLIIIMKLSVEIKKKRFAKIAYFP